MIQKISSDILDSLVNGLHYASPERCKEIQETFAADVLEIIEKIGLESIILTSLMENSSPQKIELMINALETKLNEMRVWL